MSAPLYTPHSDSLAGRVVSYFRRFPEPDEVLSAADIALKWHVDPKNVPVQLARSVEAGLLSRDGMVYGAGPDIERISLVPPNAHAKTLLPPMKKPRIAGAIDIEAIEFEDTPASVNVATVKVHDRWVAKLKTMPAGKSFVVSNEHRHALRSAATEVRKQGWQLSVLNEGSDRVRVVCSKVPEAEGETA